MLILGDLFLMSSDFGFYKRRNMRCAIVFDSGFLSLLIFLFALQQPLALMAASLLSCFYALLRLESIMRTHGGVHEVFLIVAFFILMHIIGGRQGFVSVFYIFSTVSCFYAAAGFGVSPIAHIRSCLTIVFWLFFLIIVSGFLANCGEAEPLGAIIPGSSTNGLPSYLIVVQIALSISVLGEKGRLPLISAAATLFVAVLGFGRGSIVVAFLIVLFSLIFNLLLLQRQHKYRLLHVVWIVLLCLAVGVISYIESVGWSKASLLIPSSAKWVCALGKTTSVNRGPVAVRERMMDNVENGDKQSEGGTSVGAAVGVATTKWAWGIKDPARAEMLREYLGKLDLFSLWFGADYDDTSIMSQYGGNPHSSYIRLHSHYGLPGLILVLLSPLLIVIGRKDGYLKFAVFVLVFFVLLRAITEPILFPTVLDFFYFLYFFIYLNHVDGGQSLRRSC